MVPTPVELLQRSTRRDNSIRYPGQLRPINASNAASLKDERRPCLRREVLEQIGKVGEALTQARQLDCGREVEDQIRPERAFAAGTREWPLR